MRTILASALCTILTAATTLGQSQTVSTTGHVVVEFEPEWAQLSIPVQVKGDHRDESHLKKFMERCDSMVAVIRSICDTSVTVWYGEAEPWCYPKGRKYKVIGTLRTVYFILRDLRRLEELDESLSAMGLAKPECRRVGLHSDTTALKYVIGRAAEHARVQAEAAAAPLGAKVGNVVELKANPPSPDPRYSTCGILSQEETILNYYGYDRPPIVSTRLPKVRLRGHVQVVWSIG